MPNRPRGAPGTPRRAFLRTLVLAPAAAAAAGVGCAGAGGSAPGSGGAANGRDRAAPAPDAGDSLAAVRSFPLSDDAEPAAVFRATGTRSREP